MCWREIPAGHLCRGKAGILCMYEPEKYDPDAELPINFPMEEEEDGRTEKIHPGVNTGHICSPDINRVVSSFIALRSALL